MYPKCNLDSFFAYDRDGDKLISRREFIQFLEESWKAAFRLLSEAIDVKTAGVTIKDIESWSTSKVPTLNENTSKIFTTFANGKEVKYT